MERSVLMKMMKDAIFSVLETMFFQVVQFVEDTGIEAWFEGEQKLIGAALDFEGPFSGSFFFFVSANKASKITADFLGIETAEVDEKQREDTVKEALNMIGGNMLSRSEEKGGFRLGIPKMIQTTALTRHQFDEFDDMAILIDCEGDHLTAGLRVN
jgi:chemotaxis protein CheY-P-specific phosphatase CheC